MHLAGTATHTALDRTGEGSRGTDDRRIAMEAVKTTRYPFHLASFAYPRDAVLWSSVWDHHPSTVIIDSGAFTAYTLGKVISLADYARFIRRFPEVFPTVAESLFVSLDVIGDQEATWRNHRRLTDRGCDVIPVVTWGSPMSDVERAAGTADYICFGGLVGRGEAGIDWLDRAYEVLAREPRMPRTHLLGVATRRHLLRFPAFSADASSWISVFRYGAMIQGRKLPQSNTSEAASAVTRKFVRDKIEAIAALGAEATSYWTRRGITWD